MNRLTLFLDNLQFARFYTMQMLEGLTDEQFYWSPVSQNPHPDAKGGEECEAFATHIAWQVGHLAMAQYGLCLFRQRGRKTEDTALMSSKFRKLFMKGTRPVPDREKYPERSEIMAVLDRVHQQVLKEVPTFSDSELDEPIDPPTAAYETRYGSLLMAVNHEMLHAGQIGLLRRLMGLQPVR